MSKLFENDLRLYDTAIDSIEGLKRNGKTRPYTSCIGHIFSHLSKEEQMDLRLPEEDRKEYIETHKTELFVQHGRVMKEFEAISLNLFEDTKRLRSHLIKSLDSTESLKPK